MTHIHAEGFRGNTLMTQIKKKHDRWRDGWIDR